MRLDSVVAGVLLGLMAPVLGFFLYGYVHTTLVRPHLDLPYFIHDLFLGTASTRHPSSASRSSPTWASSSC